MNLISISKENGSYILKVEKRKKFLNIKFGRKIVHYTWLPKSNTWLINGRKKSLSHKRKTILKKWVKSHQTFIEDYN